MTEMGMGASREFVISDQCSPEQRKIFYAINQGLRDIGISKDEFDRYFRIQLMQKCVMVAQSAETGIIQKAPPSVRNTIFSGNPVTQRKYERIHKTSELALATGGTMQIDPGVALTSPAIVRQLAKAARDMMPQFVSGLTQHINGEIGRFQDINSATLTKDQKEIYEQFNEEILAPLNSKIPAADTNFLQEFASGRKLISSDSKACQWTNVPNITFQTIGHASYINLAIQSALLSAAMDRRGMSLIEAGNKFYPLLTAIRDNTDVMLGITPSLGPTDASLQADSNATPVLGVSIASPEATTSHMPPAPQPAAGGAGKVELENGTEYQKLMFSGAWTALSPEIQKLLQDKNIHFRLDKLSNNHSAASISGNMITLNEVLFTPTGRSKISQAITGFGLVTTLNPRITPGVLRAAWDEMVERGKTRSVPLSVDEVREFQRRFSPNNKDRIGDILTMYINDSRAPGSAQFSHLLAARKKVFDSYIEELSRYKLGSLPSRYNYAETLPEPEKRFFDALNKVVKLTGEPAVTFDHNLRLTLYDYEWALVYKTLGGIQEKAQLQARHKPGSGDGLLDSIPAGVTPTLTLNNPTVDPTILVGDLIKASGHQADPRLEPLLKEVTEMVKDKDALEQNADKVSILLGELGDAVSNSTTLELQNPLRQSLHAFIRQQIPGFEQLAGWADSPIRNSNLERKEQEIRASLGDDAITNYDGKTLLLHSFASGEKNLQVLLRAAHSSAIGDYFQVAHPPLGTLLMEGIEQTAHFLAKDNGRDNSELQSALGELRAAYNELRRTPEDLLRESEERARLQQALQEDIARRDEEALLTPLAYGKNNRLQSIETRATRQGPPPPEKELAESWAQIAPLTNLLNRKFAPHLEAGDALFQDHDGQVLSMLNYIATGKYIPENSPPIDNPKFPQRHAQVRDTLLRLLSDPLETIAPQLKTPGMRERLIEVNRANHGKLQGALAHAPLLLIAALGDPHAVTYAREIYEKLFPTKMGNKKPKPLIETDRPKAEELQRDIQELAVLVVQQAFQDTKRVVPDYLTQLMTLPAPNPVSPAIASPPLSDHTISVLAEPQAAPVVAATIGSATVAATVPPATSVTAGGHETVPGSSGGGGALPSPKKEPPPPVTPPTVYEQIRERAQREPEFIEALNRARDAAILRAGEAVSHGHNQLAVELLLDRRNYMLRLFFAGNNGETTEQLIDLRQIHQLDDAVELRQRVENILLNGTPQDEGMQWHGGQFRYIDSRPRMQPRQVAVRRGDDIPSRVIDTREEPKINILDVDGIQTMHVETRYAHERGTVCFSIPLGIRAADDKTPLAREGDRRADAALCFIEERLQAGLRVTRGEVIDRLQRVYTGTNHGWRTNQSLHVDGYEYTPVNFPAYTDDVPESQRQLTRISPAYLTESPNIGGNQMYNLDFRIYARPPHGRGRESEIKHFSIPLATHYLPLAQARAQLLMSQVVNMFNTHLTQGYRSGQRPPLVLPANHRWFFDAPNARDRVRLHGEDSPTTRRAGDPTIDYPHISRLVDCFTAPYERDVSLLLGPTGIKDKKNAFSLQLRLGRHEHANTVGVTDYAGCIPENPNYDPAQHSAQSQGEQMYFLNREEDERQRPVRLDFTVAGENAADLAERFRLRVECLMHNTVADHYDHSRDNAGTVELKGRKKHDHITALNALGRAIQTAKHEQPFAGRITVLPTVTLPPVQPATEAEVFPLDRRRLDPPLTRSRSGGSGRHSRRTQPPDGHAYAPEVWERRIAPSVDADLEDSRVLPRGRH